MLQDAVVADAVSDIFKHDSIKTVQRLLDRLEALQDKDPWRRSQRSNLLFAMNHLAVAADMRDIYDTPRSGLDTGYKNPSPWYKFKKDLRVIFALDLGLWRYVERQEADRSEAKE